VVCAAVARRQAHAGHDLVEPGCAGGAG
jgi:hypothetical protein